ncbi:hypothetical protein LOY55_08745 [Pseudomonas sp. B21-040]|nr:hypothetical protein [Pseudomonas sp. B21-040]UVL43479.1 hypothetical protein LOY55_08745 [Pseudomonas sp. B21-040]
MEISTQCSRRCHRGHRSRWPNHPLPLRHPRTAALDSFSGQQSPGFRSGCTWATDRRNPAGRRSAAVFLRCSGTENNLSGRIRRCHSLPTGRRWPTDPDNSSYWRQSSLQLQRLRQDHCRTG